MCRLFKKSQPQPDFSSTRKATANAVRSLLRFVGVPDDRIFLSDFEYLLCDLDDIDTLLAQDATNKAEYIREKHDCDDFSYRLMGQFSVMPWSQLAFGIVWTDKHALNCLIDDDAQFWFVEPQTDKLTRKLEDWQGTKIRVVMM